MVKDLICMASERKITIPNIQRPYVWKPSQLAKLVDSLMHGWPCGNLLLWDTKVMGQQVFPLRCFSLGHKLTMDDTYKQTGSAIRKSDYLILDGQQRLQSLIIAFSNLSCGYAASTKDWCADGGRNGGTKTDYITKYLCFDFSHCTTEWLNIPDNQKPSFFYLDYKDEEKTPLLVWRTSEEIDNINIIKLSDSLSTPLPDSPAGQWLKGVMEELMELEISVMIVEPTLNLNLGDLDDENSIVQIFTRLNTAGTPLTKEQIQSARINSLWKDFQSSIADLLHIIQQPPYRYNLSMDDVVKGFNITLMVTHGTDNLHQAYLAQAAKIEEVPDAWSKLWSSFVQNTRLVFDLLHEKNVFFKSEYSSLYIIWFVVAALTKHPTSSDEETMEKLANLLVRFAFISTWGRIWANRSGTYVRHLTSSLVKTEEISTIDWLKNILSESLLTGPAIDAVKTLAVNHRGSVRQYYPFLWIWSRLEPSRAELLRNFADDGDSFDVDHIVPISWISENYKAEFNSLGNCWLLASSANATKSDDSMSDFLNGYNREIEYIWSDLDCYKSHVTIERSDTQMEDSQIFIKTRQSIRERTESIKRDLISFIEKIDKELYFPDINSISEASKEIGTYGIYLEEEFKNAPIFKERLSKPNTKRVYLSAIRNTIRKHFISEEALLACRGDARTTRDMKHFAQGSNRTYVSAWNKYVTFFYQYNNQGQQNGREREEVNAEPKVHLSKPHPNQPRQLLPWDVEADGDPIRECASALIRLQHGETIDLLPYYRRYAATYLPQTAHNAFAHEQQWEELAHKYRKTYGRTPFIFEKKEGDLQHQFGRFKEIIEKDLYMTGMITPFKEYNDAMGNGIPRQVLGRKNYLPFLDRVKTYLQ